MSAAKRRLDDRILEGRRALAGEPKATKAKPIAPWRLHDLRRTCATVMADQLGVLPHVVEAVLNHISGHKAGVAGVYNYAKYEREVRVALTLWADHLRTLIKGGERKVVG